MIKRDINDSLAFNISRAGVLLRRDLTKVLSDYSMTPEQWQIMMILGLSDEPVNQKFITQSLMKDKHAVSRMIQRLVKNEWVVKKTAEFDKRVTLIHFTEKGRHAKNEMHKKLSVHIRGQVFDEFTEEEKEMMKKLLRKLRIKLGDTIK